MTNEFAEVLSSVSTEKSVSHPDVTDVSVLVTIKKLRRAWDRIVAGGEYEDSYRSKYFTPFAEELGFSWEDE
jgi:hypothetical protein